MEEISAVIPRKYRRKHSKRSDKRRRANEAQQTLFVCAHPSRSTAVCSVIANWPNELKRTSPAEGPARGALFVNHRLATVLRGKVQDTPRTTGEPLGPSTCQKRSLSTTSTEHQGRSSECPPLLQLVAAQFAVLFHTMETRRNRAVETTMRIKQTLEETRVFFVSILHLEINGYICISNWWNLAIKNYKAVSNYLEVKLTTALFRNKIINK